MFSTNMCKIFQPLFIILLVINIIFTFLCPLFAFATTQPSTPSTEIKTIVNIPNYTKQKIADKHIGKTEWIDHYIEVDGTTQTIAKSESNMTTILRDKEQAIIQENNRVIAMIDFETIEDVTLLHKNSRNITFAYGAWSQPSVGYSSKSFRANTAATAISIAATILGCPPSASIAIRIGTYIYSNILTEVYYKMTAQYRFDTPNQRYQGRRTKICYKYSNHSESLGQYTQTWTGSATN